MHIERVNHAIKYEPHICVVVAKSLSVALTLVAIAIIDSLITFTISTDSLPSNSGNSRPARLLQHGLNCVSTSLSYPAASIKWGFHPNGILLSI